MTKKSSISTLRKRGTGKSEESNTETRTTDL